MHFESQLHTFQFHISAMLLTSLMMAGLPVPEAFAGGPMLKEIDGRVIMAETPEQMARMLNYIAGDLAKKGHYSRAVPIAREGLELTENIFGKVHANVSADLITLSTLYRMQGDYFNAEPLILRAIDIDKQLYGTDHPEVALDISGLAQLYEAKQDHAEAEKRYREALAIIQRADRPKYQAYTAQIKTAFGKFLLRRNRNDQGMAELIDAEKIYEGTDPAAAINVLIQLAEIDRVQGNQVRAQKWLDRAKVLKGH